MLWEKGLFYYNLTKYIVKNDLGTAYGKIIKILYTNKMQVM